MNILEQKYGTFEWNNEFPDLDMLLLYESGGDTGTFAYKILGYPSLSEYSKDKQEFTEKYKDKFITYVCPTCGFAGDNLRFQSGGGECIDCECKNYTNN